MRGTDRSVKGWIAKTFEPLRPVYDAWMALIAGFSWVFVRVGLTIAFVTIFLLYGVLLRLARKDPMSRTIDRDTSSYWTDNIVLNSTLTEFKRQY